ncbi:hypothetical protein GL2_32820 [Microbulbifer sp. GL-2]|nr:hypothetical protein GL2_32820 [Microbulbifer sp. GL-2]
MEKITIGAWEAGAYGKRLQLWSLDLTLVDHGSYEKGRAQLYGALSGQTSDQRR